jgi:hypothetical protein
MSAAATGTLKSSADQFMDFQSWPKGHIGFADHG